MRISIIGTAGIPACYGGFETLAENLVKNRTDGIEYTVFCSGRLYVEKPDTWHGAKLRYINLNANGISSIFYDFISMLLSLRSGVMLILGVSGALFLPLVRLLYRGKIIINIDGIEWRREKWRGAARFILRLSEKCAVKFSDVIIADNQGIIDYLRQTYKKEGVLIEYGADHIEAALCDNGMPDRAGK
jgi:hypothetical protein